MFLALFVALAAQSVEQLPAPPDSPGVEQGRVEQGRRGFLRRQIFVAPSGEVFVAPADAAYPVAEWFARANRAHDGKLTEAEFVADFQRFAHGLDLNGDGVIDTAEVKAYEANLAALVHAPGQHGPGGPGGPGEDGHGQWHHHDHGGEGGAGGGAGAANRPQGEARFGLLPLPEPVSAMDTAGDGRITQAEVQAAAASRFAQLDTRHQGYLVLADLPHTFAQHMRERLQGRGHNDGDGRGGGDDGPPPLDGGPGE